MFDLSNLKSFTEKKSIKEITITYIVAILFIAFGIFYQNYLNNIRTQGKKTEAKVIQYKKSRQNNGKTMYSPILQFNDNQVLVEAKAIGGSSIKKYKIGEYIGIYYLKNGDKYEVQIDSFIWNNFGNIFILFGIAAVCLGSYYIKVRVSFKVSARVN